MQPYVATAVDSEIDSLRATSSGRACATFKAAAALGGFVGAGELDRTDTERIAAALEGTGAVVVLMGVGDLGSIPRLPPTLRRILTRRGAAFNREAEAVAGKSGRIVKVPVTGRISTAFWDDPGLFGPDQFHAGPEGHRVFAEELVPVMRAALALARTGN